MKEIWKWLIFLCGAAMIAYGAIMLAGPSGFGGVFLMIWGIGLNVIMAAHGIHPLLPADGRNQPEQSPSVPIARLQLAAPRTVRLKAGKILVNDRPAVIFSGEVHYFRIKRDEWEDRLDKLQANGLNTVSTYIPWLWHELPDGSIDLTGRTHPERNLVAFLDLCAARRLNVIARPGPFVMAELKNEGIPYRVYKQYPHLRPVTWDGAPAQTATLDYLAPDFLNAVKGWYSAVMPVLSKRLAPEGGSVIAVQLDNEIGMLSWVSNSPDLTDLVLEDMRDWARQRYGDKAASRRAGADVTDKAAWAQALRAPDNDSLALHHDLGLYMRSRFKRYVQALRRLAEENGIKDIPFLINVHGTSGGRGRTFPIGVSQLFESYENEPQMTSGSDFYFGDLTVANVADLYVDNAFMAAVLGPDQPLMSLEFEAGDGNYSDDLGVLYAPEAIELKTRLCLAQGNRLLNYYLHAGGHNPPQEAAGDGIDRIAFTGERHGFAAPVGPDGKLNATYHAIGRVVSNMKEIEPLLATSVEEHDGFALGFVPDHYLSEYRYPSSLKRAEQVADLERFRGLGPRDVLARALLLGGFSFPAVNLQAGIPKHQVVVLSTGRTLDAVVQSNLAQYVRGGGKLLLVGLLPDVDDDGAPCTILADTLGLKSAGRLYESSAPNTYWPSVAVHGWAAPRPDARVTAAQLLASADGTALSPLLTEVGSGLPCAVQVSAGKGQAIVLGCDYPADLIFYRQLMAALSVVPRWRLNADGPGVVVTSTISAGGERLLHLINVAPQAVALSVSHHGQPVFGGRRITMPARSGLVLAVGTADLTHD
ncbi:MAG: glycosyl hydrolase [Cyanobacteria bacterium DS2.3.42]|nr:glycosyl hydrolase [Cyanobacteria bacterium DS2.3.42]